jgi:hypothetical protein
VPPILRIKVATLPINPVLSKPAPIIMTAIIDITAFEENPSNSLWLLTSPSSSPIKVYYGIILPTVFILDKIKIMLNKKNIAAVIFAVFSVWLSTIAPTTSIATVGRIIP